MSDPAITYLPFQRYSELAEAIVSLRLPLDAVRNPDEAEASIRAATIETFKLLTRIGIRPEDTDEKAA